MCLQMLRDQHVPFIAAINPQWFTPIVQLLTDRVQASGDMCFAVHDSDRRGDPKELATCFYSPDSKKGKRFTLTNYLKEIGHKRRRGHIPGFDEYEENFAGCDSFNRRLHDKSWQCKYASLSYSVEIQAGHNFLFTCALVNAQHLWKTLDFQNRENTSFKSFTEALALEIVGYDFGLDDE